MKNMQAALEPGGLWGLCTIYKGVKAFKIKLTTVHANFC